MEFQRVMTYDQMQQHLTEHTCTVPNRVTVGKYARRHGYRPYKPMIGGRLYFYYVNEAMPATEKQNDHAE